MALWICCRTRRDIYPQFPRSPLGTLGTMTPFWRAHTKKEKETLSFFSVSMLKQAWLITGSYSGRKGKSQAAQTYSMSINNGNSESGSYIDRLKRIGAGESTIFDLRGVNKKNTWYIQIYNLLSLYHCLFICPGYFSTEISTFMFLEFDAPIF